MGTIISQKITSLGVGLTSLCNLNCPHCYSRKLPMKSLTLLEFKKIINKFPHLEKINFGTGESILNKDIKKIMDYLESNNIGVALTSNGYTVNHLSSDYVKKFKDVDISLDFPRAILHDRWRGKKGTFTQAIQAIEKCKKLHVNVSIAMALMNNNFRYLSDFRKLLNTYNVPLRINLYKPVNTKKYLMSYGQFWQAMKVLSENFELISNSEPVLTIITGDRIKGSPCGNSARLHPNGKVTPCVYLMGTETSYGFKQFTRLKLKIPKLCRSCSVARNCRGGCLGRRLLTNHNSPEPDQYCPILKGEPIPSIKFRRATGHQEFIHSGYLCTIIVK